MIKDWVLKKVQTFQVNAASVFGQKEAEKIWAENAWKLALSYEELKSLQDGWAKFIINGDRSQLDASASVISTRLLERK
jgi:hypothetical protein